MGKASKATKKFQKHHLGRELTKRKHDQKKKQIREKSLAKYAPKEGEDAGASGEEEEEIELPAAVAGADEREVFSVKAKLKPQASASHRIDRKAAPAAAAGAGGYAKPAAKKAPSIEDLDVDSFLDGSFLDDASRAHADQSALDDADSDEDDEDAEMDGEEGEDEEEEEQDEDENAGDEDLDEAALLAEIEAHERELADLEKTDPEFYSHLQKEDKELLHFNAKDEMGGDDDEEEEDMDMGGDDDEDAHGAASKGKGKGKDGEAEVLDWAGLKELEKQVMGPVWSVRALKKLVRIFRSAVHIGEVTQGKGKGVKAQSEEQKAKEAAFRHEVQIHSSRVFNELVRFVFNSAKPIWAHHFKAEAGSAKKEKDSKDGASAAAPAAAAVALEKHPKWSTMGPILKAFLGHVLHFLSTLHANPKMSRFVLGRNLERLVPLFEPFNKLATKLLRELLVFWSEGERDVRIDAFLRIRQMAIELSGKGSASGESMLELALKGIYLTYVRNSKFASALTLPVIEFMANSVVEIYGLDPVLAYQHAFVYIRQLAIHLRQALLAKKKDSHRMVYNWNFVCCLKVWGKVLAAHGQASSASAGQNGALAAADNLHALVYPYVQVCLGTLTVLPSSRYFPLRFHVVRMLIDLCEHCSIFVPLAPHLLGVLSAPELSRKPTSSTRKVADIRHVLKASRHVIATKTFQESAVSEALHLLLAYFNLYSTSAAFNELILPTTKLLRKAAKETVVIHRVRKQIQQFVLKLEHNASWIAAKRNACNWAPKDMMETKRGIDGLRTFAVDPTKSGAAQTQQSPLSKYVAVALEERRLLDDSQADWDGSKGSRALEKRAGKKAAKGSDDEDDEDEDDKYDRKKAQRDAEDDDEMDGGEDDEGEDDEGDEDDDGEDGEDDEDEDAPRSKKSKAANGKPAAAPFHYPAGFDADAADGDMLEELNFSDDEGDNKTKKQKKQQQKKKAAPAPAAASAKKQPKLKQEKQQTPVKKEGQQQQQQKGKQQQQQQKGKAAASPAGDKKRKRV